MGFLIDDVIKESRRAARLVGMVSMPGRWTWFDPVSLCRRKTTNKNVFFVYFRNVTIVIKQELQLVAVFLHAVDHFT